jgi:ribonucleoside-diphosphate reductase alpha chain
MDFSECESVLFSKRNKLDDTRPGKTIKFALYTDRGESVDVYFTINCFDNGFPGELWVWIGKEGSEVHGWANCFAIAISMLLQHNVNPEEIYEKFINQSFSPSGMTGTSWAPICNSIVDAIMKYMKAHYPPTKVDDDYEMVMNS